MVLSEQLQRGKSYSAIKEMQGISNFSQGFMSAWLRVICPSDKQHRQVSRVFVLMSALTLY